MYCTESILINNRWIWLSIRTSGDCNFLRQIQLRDLLRPSAYQLSLMRRADGNGYRFRVIGKPRRSLY